MKYLLTLFVTLSFLVYANIAWATVTVMDSYSESNSSGSSTIGPSGLLTRYGQSFTANGQYVDSVKFYLKKTGNPTGNAYAKIYSHTGTFGTDSVPNGSALNTSEAIDVSSFSTSLSLITFNFTGLERILLTNGVNYVVTVEYVGGDGVSNFVSVGRDSVSPTHSGNASRFISSWEYLDAVDAIFYVYGDDAPPPVVASDLQNLITFE